jgi:hypothetical protein
VNCIATRRTARVDIDRYASQYGPGSSVVDRGATDLDETHPTRPAEKHFGRLENKYVGCWNKRCDLQYRVSLRISLRETLYKFFAGKEPPVAERGRALPSEASGLGINPLGAANDRCLIFLAT